MSRSSSLCELVDQDRVVLVTLRRHRRAKRYTIRIGTDGKVVVTVPPRGSFSWAAQFAREQSDWILTRLNKIKRPLPLKPGSDILYRGERVVIHVHTEITGFRVQFSDQSFSLKGLPDDLKNQIERHLRIQATTELRSRTIELATLHGIGIARIRIGAQRSRWGSCSSKGTISLNWRLIQTPLHVRDYIILHELAHRQHMNHSPSFWGLVEKLCPTYKESETWLKSNPGILL